MSTRALSRLLSLRSHRHARGFSRRSFVRPVEAVFYVATVEPDRSAKQVAVLRGVVIVDGMKGTSVSHRCIPPGQSWPQVGERLAVVTDLADPHRLRIRWSSR